VCRETGVGVHSSCQRPLVSVIIVNFNGGELLSLCVQTVLSSSIPLEVFVSDNGSTDGSVSLLRCNLGDDTRLSVIENHQNLGFSRANNLAAKWACGEYILYLNPDCILKEGTLTRMLAAMAVYPEAGMAGPLIRNTDGSEQAGCRRAVPTPWRTLVRVLHLNKLFPDHPRFRTFLLNQEPLPVEPAYIEAISGAFMLVRRQAYNQVGPLDEGYFLHCDDLDWCMRFRQAGWKILFVPDVEVVHYKGMCSKDRPIQVLWHKHRGMVRFYRKFFRHQYPLPLMALVVSAVWVRFALLVIHTILPRRQEAEGETLAVPFKSEMLHLALPSHNPHQSDICTSDKPLHTVPQSTRLDPAHYAGESQSKPPH